MIVYLKYFVTWLFFMVLIAAITLIVPKLSKKIDKWRAEKKAQMKREEGLMSPPGEEHRDEQTGDSKEKPKKESDEDPAETDPKEL